MSIVTPIKSTGFSMTTYLARYTLRNGVQGVLTLIAGSSCAAILIAIDIFGEQLRTCSARPG